MQSTYTKDKTETLALRVNNNQWNSWTRVWGEGSELVRAAIKEQIEKGQTIPLFESDETLNQTVMIRMSPDQKKELFEFVEERYGKKQVSTFVRTAVEIHLLSMKRHVIKL